MKRILVSGQFERILNALKNRDGKDVPDSTEGQ